MYRCPTCGASDPVGPFTRCVNCGYRFVDDPSEWPDGVRPEPGNPDSFRPPVPGLGCLAVVLFGLRLWWVYLGVLLLLGAVLLMVRNR